MLQLVQHPNMPTTAARDTTPLHTHKQYHQHARKLKASNTLVCDEKCLPSSQQRHSSFFV
jgi:hypothetical protein